MSRYFLSGSMYARSGRGKQNVDLCIEEAGRVMASDQLL